jgi:dTMP kinase
MAGKLICFEGIDGSGTTTQARLLHGALMEFGLPVHLTREPSDGPAGGLIRQILQGRLVTRGRTGPRAPSWNTMGLMFAADRLDHIESEIEPNLQDGINIITDRYLHSSLVYQSAASDWDGALDWLKEINRFAVEPDLVIYLDVEPDVAQRRRLDSRMIQEIFDDREIQQRICVRYRELMKMLDEEKLLWIDGSQPPEKIHRICLDRLAQLGIP